MTTGQIHVSRVTRSWRGYVRGNLGECHAGSTLVRLLQLRWMGLVMVRSQGNASVTSGAGMYAWTLLPSVLSLVCGGGEQEI